MKKFVALLVTIISFSAPQITYAQKIPSNDESGYLEYHYQINFDELDVFVVNGTALDITLQAI